MNFPYKLILDENIPISIFKYLKNHNYDAISIKDKNRGMSDVEIIQMSQNLNSIVITFDKDFGFLTFQK